MASLIYWYFLAPALAFSAELRECEEWAVEYEGACYGVIDQSSPDSDSQTCQSQPYELPRGYSLVPFSQDVQDNVASRHSFGTVRVVYGNGQTWATGPAGADDTCPRCNTGTPCGRCDPSTEDSGGMASNNLVSDGGSYNVANCNAYAKVFVMRELPSDTTTITTTTMITTSTSALDMFETSQAIATTTTSPTAGLQGDCGTDTHIPCDYVSVCEIRGRAKCIDGICKCVKGFCTIDGGHFCYQATDLASTAPQANSGTFVAIFAMAVVPMAVLAGAGACAYNKAMRLQQSQVTTPLLQA